MSQPSCPVCSSNDDVEKLTYTVTDEAEKVRNKYPSLFPYEYSAKGNTEWKIMRYVAAMSIFVCLIGLVAIILSPLTGVTAAVLSAISVIIGINIQNYGGASDSEKKYISKARNNYYCHRDKVIFGEEGIVDIEDEVSRVKEDIKKYENYYPVLKLRSSIILGVLSAVVLVSPIFLPSSHEEVSTNKAFQEKNTKKEVDSDLIAESKGEVGEISSNPSFLYDGDINGKYSFPVGEGLDISVVFVTWDKLESINAKISEERRKEYSDHDGLFYAYEGGSKGMLLGAWKLSNRMIDGFRKKFVFINTAKFRDGSLGDKDIGILYGEGEGPSLGIHVRGNRFFSAYPKKDLPRNRSFYAD